MILLLNRIKTKELYFQSHNYNEAQMDGSYRNYTSDEFAQFISKYTKLKYKLIGETKDHRMIYKFSNENI